MAVKAKDKDKLLMQIGFAGGLNLRDAIDELSPAEASAVLNMVYNDRGAAISRLGCTSKASVGSAGDRILSMHLFERMTSGPQLIVHTTAGELKYTNDLSSFTNIATGLSSTAPFSYETFNGKVYMSNGVDDYRSWDGTTQTTFASAPKFKYLRLWKDTMWGAGETSFLTRIRSSAAGDAETWPANNFTHLHKDDGDPIMGLGQNGTFLIPMKRNKVFAVYDAALLSNRLVDYEKGCEGHFTILNHENNVYYLSKKGIVRWLDNSPGVIMSWRVDPLFDPARLNYSALTKAYGYIYRHRLGWTIPEAGQTSPSFQIELYPNLPEFPLTVHRMPVQAFASWRDSTNEILVGGKTSGNKLLQAFSGADDDGSAYTSFIETGWHDFDLPNSNKYLRYLRVLGKGQFTAAIKRNYKENIAKSLAFSKSTSIDLWDTSQFWDTTKLWGEGSSNPQYQPFHPDVYGYQFALRFTGTIAGTNVRKMDVGGVQYLDSIGQWGIYHTVMHAIEMGDRIPV